MDYLIEQKLEKLNPKSLYEKKNSIRHIVQDIILCALTRSGRLDNAALHGDQARRIYFDPNGFSEDPVFSLIEPDENFRLDTWLSLIEKELAAYGFSFKAELKERTKRPDIQAAVISGNTREHFALCYDDPSEIISETDMIKVKLEVNTNPPLYAEYTKKNCTFPVPHEINMYDKPSLFAEKIGNTISRAWRNRTRGWDLYDYAFYVSQDIPVNLEHLRARLLYLEYVEAKEDMTIEEVRNNLCYRFKEINYKQVKIDLLPFVKDPESLDVWSAAYFCGITQKLRES